MENMKRKELIVRQHSKVEKIPDDESEEILLKKTDSETEDRTTECVHHQLNNKNKAFARALSRTSDKDENATEFTLNGDLHIIMPNTDDTFKYREDEGMETDIDIKKSKLKSQKVKKGPCVYLRTKCSKQIVVNICFGIFIAIAIFIGIKSLHKNSENSQQERYMYCYACQSITGHEMYVKHVNDMCCTNDPVQKNTAPKTSQQKSQEQKSVVTSSYNSTRILEFQAIFNVKWNQVDGNDVIPWKPLTSTEQSFATFKDGGNEILLNHDGNYVITLSLTTDTFTRSTSSIREMACLVFTFPDGMRREECRQITHTDKMVIPFQIFKFDTLRRGTVLHAFITSSKALNARSTHNKLYIVLL